SIDDAVHGNDPVCNKPFSYHFDYRDASGNRCLKPYFNACPFSLSKEFIPLCGEQRLVCGNHMLPVPYRLEYEFLCRMNTSHKLNYDIDIRIVKHCGCVGSQHAGRNV